MTSRSLSLTVVERMAPRRSCTNRALRRTDDLTNDRFVPRPLVHSPRSMVLGVLVLAAGVNETRPRTGRSSYRGRQSCSRVATRACVQYRPEGSSAPPNPTTIAVKHRAVFLAHHQVWSNPIASDSWD